MKPVVKMIKNNWPAVKKGLAALPKNDVLVGIPASGNARSDGPIGNAAIGYIHETGAPEANIPARPWLRPGIRNAREAIAAGLKVAGRRALAGEPEAVLQALHTVGLTAQQAVKASLGSNVPPPLKAGTLAARRRRGNQGTHTLMDTGNLQAHINYVIREN